VGRAVGTRSEAWARLVREIEACRACPLGSTRRRAVVYRGGERPRVLFVGEAPGRQEDETGRPFVGRSGARLDAAIERLDLAPDSVGVLNVVKCHPPGNRLPLSSVSACRPFLERQLEILRPTTLVPLGRHALRAVAPDAPPILEASGRPIRTPLGPAFPLLHPAAALRSRRWAERWDRDVGALGAWLRSPGSETL